MNLPGRIPLATRFGRPIPNEQCLDPPPHQVAKFNASFERKFSAARLRRPPTGQYNCHGLTFANRRTWIHPIGTQQSITALLTDILSDDGYCTREGTLKVVGLQDVSPGDIVIYFEGEEIDHTGIVAWVDRDARLVGGAAVWVLSKWAAAGEYVHPVALCPYHNPRFVTDR